MQQQVARGMRAAGENGGAGNMAFMGMGMNMAGNMMGAMQQPTYGQPMNQQPTQVEEKKEDPYEKLASLKKLLDQGIISQEEFDKAKAKLLDL